MLERWPHKLARWIHRDGTQLRSDVEKSLAGMSRQWSVDDVLDCAVVKGWLVNHGNRVSRGEIDPGWSIERDTSGRYVPVGEAEYVPS